MGVIFSRRMRKQTRSISKLHNMLKYDSSGGKRGKKHYRLNTKNLIDSL